MAAINKRIFLLWLLRRRIQKREGQITNSTKKKKRMWVRKIFSERNWKGEYHLLVKQMIMCDHEYFFKMFRMKPQNYEKNIFLFSCNNLLKTCVILNVLLK